MTVAAGPVPLILAVAPNGARKTKADHPALPMNADEIGLAAAACRAAGAVMIHLHVRTPEGTHTLDADLYNAAIAAVRRQAGPDFIIQVTSESVGLYTPDQQRAMVKSVRPEAVSLAIRELCATPEDEPEFAAFTEWMVRESVHPQYILYDADDVARFADLQRRGVLSSEGDFILYVLGRYSKSLTSDPTDLLPFLAMAQAQALTNPWAMCAFGPKEAACGLTAAALGGHCRLGFENNLRLANGEIAPDNAHLIAQIADNAVLAGRVLADEHSARLALGIK
ncbi:MAG TPA: class III aminotransferase [Rhodospirillaceae bacterium]|nr:class III aminotransferase [Rhodospirillaceae bacterium]MAX60892.1 class III aminotransferase [Rhodospirillaceae bacterium]MAX65214.1 class III aminotransferase [Rhodospirillaceae bacterium]MBB55629.1 class III aminotransferase [Rhodospirillaceae bacterium]HAJ20729.1 class III aminotransferase [Rhodospirillaceae bacterium]|tara:strand:+ start:14603 stop:15445 length:843 start_codon:yes stop_codon:yes gene_type:complete